MTCKHCNKPIELKKGIWTEILTKEDIDKLEGWKYDFEYAIAAVCFQRHFTAVMLGLPEHSEHEPTKESKVEQLLRDVDDL